MTGRGDPGIASLLREGRFASLPPEAHDRLAAEATRESIPAGELLFSAGDPTGACYVVETGSFEVLAEPDARVLRVLSRGAALGELGVLAGASRSASVRARRDATVIRIDAAQFTDLLEHPAFAAAQIRALATELQASRPMESGTRDAARLIAVVPGSDGAPSTAVAARLAELLAGRVRCTVISPEPGAEADDPFELPRRLAARVAEAERAADLVLLDAGGDGGGEAWTAACTRQGDRLVVVVDAPEAAPPEVPIEQGVPIDIVFCGARPTLRALGRWLDALAPRAHWFASAGPRFTGLEREARSLAGRSVALVLSGGGARAFSAIGIVDELRQAGVVPDRLGGTSAGAYVGGLVARGLGTDQMIELVRAEFVQRNPLGDLTVPIVAVTRGQRAQAMVRSSFGDLHAEQLEARFFAVSVDILTGDEVVLHRGPLHTIVGASMSVPGVLPPVPYRDWMLLDGGIVNNFPVEEMLSVADGPVVAIDVSAGYRRRSRPSTSASGRPASLEPVGRRMRRLVTGSEQPLPGIRDVLGASMDLRGVIASSIQPAAVTELLIRPDASDIGIFEWDRIEEAIARGRVAARAAIEADPERVAAMAAG